MVQQAKENPELFSPQRNSLKKKEEEIDLEESDDVPKPESELKNLPVAEQIHRRIFEKFGADIYKQKLSLELMNDAVDQRHPRDRQSNCLIPLSKGTGSFRKADKGEGIQDLGIAVSTYFKILKMLMYFFSLFTIMCLPLYFIYSCGSVSLQANGWFKEYLTEWTLGNMGESSYKCNMRDVVIYDTNYLQCPPGSKMKELKYFGL